MSLFWRRISYCDIYSISGSLFKICLTAFSNSPSVISDFLIASGRDWIPIFALLLVKVTKRKTDDRQFRIHKSVCFYVKISNFNIPCITLKRLCCMPEWNALFFEVDKILVLRCIELSCYVPAMLREYDAHLDYLVQHFLDSESVKVFRVRLQDLTTYFLILQSLD